MPEPTLSFPDRLKARFGERAIGVVQAHGETTMEVAPDHWIEVIRALRDEPEFGFELLVDVCGVDYLGYGDDEWDTSDVSSA
ncbi:MAG: NADH-quinone oxidoreductase subunit C, partial [Frankiaceae bacterium]|nr:NADH-quinone oxidoreductase subunit C [Arenimonas sp.]